MNYLHAGVGCLSNRCLPLQTFGNVVTISLGLPLRIRILQFLHKFYPCLIGSMGSRSVILFS
jgi:hypothetical protein